jgi:lysophospholipase L1-like esterase
LGKPKPALANKDYVHPNAKGADILAENFSML